MEQSIITPMGMSLLTCILYLVQRISLKCFCRVGDRCQLMGYHGNFRI